MAVALRVENEIGLPRKFFNESELCGSATNIHIQKILEICIDKNTIPFLANVKEYAMQDTGGEFCGGCLLDNDGKKIQK